MTDRLQKESVLIIGGSGALGDALAPKLEKQGFHVVIADVNPPLGNRYYKYMDATDPHSIELCRDSLENDGIRISHVVVVVGALIESGLTDMFESSDEEIDKTIELNLKSHLYALRHLGQHVSEGESDNKSFTLISSINAHNGYSIPFYSAAKGGLHGVLKPAAMNFGASGVRINIVTPGTVQTPSTREQPKNYKARAEAAALGRLCSEGEVADGVMACINLTGMTGQEIVIDAGQSINPSQSLYDQRRLGIAPQPKNN